jgi:hypothetical protein
VTTDIPTEAVHAAASELMARYKGTPNADEFALASATAALAAALPSLRYQWAQDLRVQINLLPTHDLDGLPIPPLDMRHAASDLVREFGETNP